MNPKSSTSRSHLPSGSPLSWPCPNCQGHQGDGNMPALGHKRKPVLCPHCDLAPPSPFPRLYPGRQMQNSFRFGSRASTHPECEWTDTGRGVNMSAGVSWGCLWLPCFLSARLHDAQGSACGVQLRDLTNARGRGVISSGKGVVSCHRPRCSVQTTPDSHDHSSHCS